MAKPTASLPPRRTGPAPAIDGAKLARVDRASSNALRLDSQLIVQIGQRNEHALGALYDCYGGLVYTIALRIAGERARAETIVQDVFYAVWQSASGFQIGSSVPGWLIGLARQRASTLSQPRSAHVGRRTEAAPEEHASRDRPQGQHSADAITALHLFDALPADQRETLELAYYDGLTCRQIATRLREPVDTIMTRLRKGLCTLSEELNSDKRT